MLLNQETPVHLILIEESEAASTVVLLSLALKKKVSRRKWAVEKEKKVCEKDRGWLKMLSDARKENFQVHFCFSNLSKRFCKFCQTFGRS